MPIGAKKANLSAEVEQYLQEVALNEQVRTQVSTHPDSTARQHRSHGTNKSDRAPLAWSKHYDKTSCGRLQVCCFCPGGAAQRGVDTDETT